MPKCPSLSLAHSLFFVSFSFSFTGFICAWMYGCIRNIFKWKQLWDKKKTEIWAMAAKTMKHYPISRRPQKPTNRTSIEQDHMHAHTTRYKHTQRTHGLTLTQSLSLSFSLCARALWNCVLVDNNYLKLWEFILVRANDNESPSYSPLIFEEMPTERETERGKERASERADFYPTFFFVTISITVLVIFWIVFSFLAEWRF